MKLLGGFPFHVKLEESLLQLRLTRMGWKWDRKPYGGILFHLEQKKNNYNITNYQMELTTMNASQKMAKIEETNAKIQTWPLNIPFIRK